MILEVSLFAWKGETILWFCLGWIDLRHIDLQEASAYLDLAIVVVGMVAEHLEAMLAPQAEEGAQGHDAEVGIVAVDDGLGGLAGGRVLADRGGPAVHFARSGNQLVDVGLGLRRRTNALLLDDQDVDRAVTRVRRTGGEGEARESGGEAEGTMVA